jgi:TRAP-type C4-dicarboxylate transport system permease small subunit
MSRVRSKVLRIIDFIEHLSKRMTIVSGISLTFIMFLTVLDVIMRRVGHPLIGAYDIIGLSGAFVIGFSIPFSSTTRTHIYMEFPTNRLRRNAKRVMNTVTRIIAIAIFLIISITLYHIGSRFLTEREVTQTAQVLIYPFVYGLGVCCFIECFVFIHDIVRIWEGKYE